VESPLDWNLRILQAGRVVLGQVGGARWRVDSPSSWSLRALHGGKVVLG